MLFQSDDAGIGLVAWSFFLVEWVYVSGSSEGRRPTVRTTRGCWDLRGCIEASVRPYDT